MEGHVQRFSVPQFALCTAFWVGKLGVRTGSFPGRVERRARWFRQRLSLTSASLSSPSLLKSRHCVPDILLSIVHSALLRAGLLPLSFGFPLFILGRDV